MRIIRGVQGIAAVSMMLWLLTGCAGVATAENVSTTTAAHGGSATAADPGGNTGGEIAITREAVLPGSVETVFDFIVAADVLPKILTGYGPVPAVVGTSDQTGPWDKVGSQRVVHTRDGGTVLEQVTGFSRPTGFHYHISDFHNPLHLLASAGRGDWSFTPVSGGTRVVWTYTFTARNRLAWLPLDGFAHLFWRGYMDVCLHNSQRLLEADTAARSTGLAN